MSGTAVERDGAVLVHAGSLKRLVADCFEGLGISGHDAETVAEVLVDANCRGEASHGIERVPIYLQRVRAGLAGGTERMSVVTESGPLCRIDAGHALGPAAGVKGIDTAVGLARQHGIALVALGNSTHFGAAGFYARRAALRDFVAIVLSNAPKSMVPHGAVEAFLGANPIAIAVPLGDRPPFVLDISTSIVARGKIRRAKTAGESIEPGLALDEDGRPTRTRPPRSQAACFRSPDRRAPAWRWRSISSSASWPVPISTTRWRRCTRISTVRTTSGISSSSSTPGAWHRETPCINGSICWSTACTVCGPRKGSSEFATRVKAPRTGQSVAVGTVFPSRLRISKH